MILDAFFIIILRFLRLSELNRLGSFGKFQALEKYLSFSERVENNMHAKSIEHIACANFTQKRVT